MRAVHRIKELITLGCVIAIVGCNNSVWVKATIIKSKNLPSNSIRQKALIRKDKIITFINTKKLTQLSQQSTLDNSLFSEKKKTNSAKIKKSDVKSKKYAVLYSGARFIREKRYHFYHKQKEIVLAIAGRAVIKKGSSAIHASRIEVLGDNGYVALAYKPVVIYDTKEKTKLTANYAEYRKFEKRVLIKGDPKIIHRNQKNNSVTEITSIEMERDMQKAISKCYGNVVVKSDDYVLYAKEAIFYEKEHRIILKGEPRAFQQDNIVLADSIEITLNKNKIKFHDKVKFYLTQSSTDESNLAKVTTIISSDKAEYTSKLQKEKYKEKMNFFSIANKIRIERESLLAYAGEVQVLGKNGNKIIIKKGFRSKDKLSGNLIYSENAIYDKENDRIILTKGDKKLKPVMFIFDKKSKLLSSVIEAASIERRPLAKRSTLKGDTLFYIYSNNNSKKNKLYFSAIAPMPKIPKATSLVGGQIAEIDNVTNIAIVRGQPYVKANSSKIFAREIRVNSKTNRFELLGAIHGQLSAEN